MATAGISGLRESSSLPLTSLGDSARSENRFDSGSFQIAVPVWDLKSVILYILPLGLESLFPIALWLSLTWVPLVLKAKYSGDFSSQVKTSKLRSSIWGSDPPVRSSMTVMFLPFVGHQSGGEGPDYTTSAPLLPVSLWSLLSVFRLWKIFLLVFRSFS